MNANIAALLYLVCGVLFILSLRGLSSPATSRQGNVYGMVGMAIAIVTTLLYRMPVGLSSWALVIAGIAIGDVLDGNFLFRHPGPHALPHSAGNPTVNGAHPVGLPGKPQGQNGHAEGFPLLVHPRTTQLKKFLKPNLTLADIGSEVFLHHLRVKSIVAGRHRGVRGEETAGRHELQSLDEAKFLLGDQHPDPLQTQKRSVALVHVKDGGL